MVEQFFHSLVFRPYVTIFLLAFIALSWLEQGKLRTLVWLVSGYLVALLAEWASVNPDIRLPFGYYVYHEDVLAKDLSIFGVPCFDSISFAFLSYVSFSFAQYFMAPLWVRGLDTQRLAPRAVRNSAAVLFLGALLMTVLDLVIDPLAHLGKYWFLGDIYHYPSPGIHFNVPMANYAGWFVVGWVVIFINQRFDSWLGTREALRGRRFVPRPVPLKGLFAPMFWAGIAAFMLGVTYVLGFGDQAEIDHPRVQLQALTGTFIIAPILALALVQRLKPSNLARVDDVEAYLADYPDPRLRAELDAGP